MTIEKEYKRHFYHSRDVAFFRKLVLWSRYVINALSYSSDDRGIYAKHKRAEDHHIYS